MKPLIIFSIILFLLLLSCSKENPEQKSNNSSDQQTATIEEKSKEPTTNSTVKVDKATVIAENNYILTKSGLKYADITIGKGRQAGLGKKVEVHYTGWLTNGKRFDSSVLRNKPFPFTIGKKEVIKGWDEGVATMKEGGIRQLILPPNLAYGSRGAGGVIPPDATLIFEVQLLRILN
jgi:peptidylprolyl isomerase